ncbi:MlaD family protein [Pseudohoeflea coraliihabitans]|uniref:MCE family protein n=1 Tax=Pseudohoeflea coraliihabitans TaxID=2860393 RepID=A0ABS6WSK4_9HYPH|nr:MlaD family protein [Pseudohoeflea sp. DP4N28-3]MBW3098055.1 MCE family protein [Pseudohoeflea sp. DP4N28-3]
METRANYAIVGLFTVLVILSAFGFVYWMARVGGGGEMAQLMVRIPGSANGLSVGSPVRFNGIAVGSIRRLAIDRDSPNYVVAQTEVQINAPIFPDTKAALEVQGLTGSAYIELRGGTPGQETVIQKALQEGRIPVIEAEPSNITNILATADQILNRANNVVGQIESFVGEAREPLTQTLRNAEEFSGSLARNAEGIDRFLQSVSSLSTTLESVSARLDTTLAAAQDLLESASPERITAIVENVEKVTGDVAAASGDIGQTVTQLGEAVESFKAFGEQASVSLERIDAVMEAVDPEKVQQVINDVSAASADARQTLSDARSVAKTFSDRNADYDQIVTDVKQIANRLNAASTRVDGVLAKLDSLLGSDDSSSLMADARATLQSFRSVADNLNARITPIADNLQRFSSSGLNDVEALVRDARRSIERIERSISSIESDPQRILFGGDTVKQYDGRTRR